MEDELRMNKDQQWYMRAGKRFSIIPISFLLLALVFKPIRDYIGIMLVAFFGMWGVTLINVWLSKDYKQTHKSTQK